MGSEFEFDMTISLYNLKDRNTWLQARNAAFLRRGKMQTGVKERALRLSSWMTIEMATVEGLLTHY